MISQLLWWGSLSNRFGVNASSSSSDDGDIPLFGKTATTAIIHQFLCEETRTNGRRKLLDSF